jgi:hypothetical protein
MFISAMDLRISHLIDDIACSGVHPETARARVSSYAKNGLIWFRAGTNTSPNLYRIDDAAAAVVLSALQDCGIADLDIQRDVCCEIYLRIRRCLAGLAKGESWSMVIDIYRDGSSAKPRRTLTRREFIDDMRNRLGAHSDTELPELLDELQRHTSWGTSDISTVFNGAKLSVSDGTLPVLAGPSSAMIRRIAAEVLDAYGY